MSLDVHIETSFTDEDHWKAMFSPPQGGKAWLKKITTLVLETVDLLPASAAVEVSFLFADNAKMRELNRIFRGQDKPTNVLSFPAFEREDYTQQHFPPLPVLMVGDVAFAVETIQQEASLSGKSFEAHLTHLLIHGLLHLQGYDHEREEEAVEMERLEIELLSRLGFSNPYISSRACDETMD